MMHERGVDNNRGSGNEMKSETMTEGRMPVEVKRRTPFLYQWMHRLSRSMPTPTTSPANIFWPKLRYIGESCKRRPLTHFKRARIPGLVTVDSHRSAFAPDNVGGDIVVVEGAIVVRDANIQIAGGASIDI